MFYCSSCRKRFESVTLIGYEESETQSCPHCGSDRFEEIIEENMGEINEECQDDGVIIGTYPEREFTGYRFGDTLRIGIRDGNGDVHYIEL